MISFHPDELLSFWFGVNTDSQSSLAYPPPSDVAYIKTRMPLWFGKNDDFELKQKEIADTYLEIIAAWETYVAEEYQTIYEVWNTPKGCLARIILFDQIPRCIFRATPRAFAYDSIAVKYALIIAEDENLWKGLTAIERLFVIVSIQHMEDMALQEKGVRLAYNIGEEESKEIQEYFKNLKGFPMEHHDVMKQFGRFPGRNQVLGRESTEDEIAWLLSPDCPAWAKSQQPSTNTNTSTSHQSNNNKYGRSEAKCLSQKPL